MKLKLIKKSDTRICYDLETKNNNFCVKLNSSFIVAHNSRVIVDTKTGEMFSRSRKKILSCPHIGEEVKKCNFDFEWLDGELYSHSLTFNDIQSIIRKSENIDFDASKKDIKMYVFDIVDSLDQMKRQKKLQEIFASHLFNYLITVPYIVIKAEVEEINRVHNMFVQQGFEGLMIRIPDKGYEQKRSYSLFKYKYFKDEEYEVVGFECEKNKPDVLGSVTCKTKEGLIFNARPAMTQEERDVIWKQQNKFLGKMATIKYQELDAKTNIPRFPVLKGFRDMSDLGV